MRDISPFNFGLIVAYLVPGFVILWGLSFHCVTVAAWLVGPAQTAPTVGGLFYATIASVACGMIANVFRWAIIDTIHHHTGIRLPRWNFSLLDQERLGGYELLVELHYRYHQFFANMLIALVFTYVAYRWTLSDWMKHWGPMDLGFVVVCAVLFLGSRDALQKYYRRAGELLTPNRWRCVMANGGDKAHHGEKRVEPKQPKAATGKPAVVPVKRPAAGK